MANENRERRESDVEEFEFARIFQFYQLLENHVQYNVYLNFNSIISKIVKHQNEEYKYRGTDILTRRGIFVETSRLNFCAN